MASNENPGEIFQTLLGDISEEQWETYKELNRSRGGLVCNEISDSESSEEEMTEESTHEMIIPEIINITGTTEEPGKMETSENEEECLQPTVWNSDLTFKYINGEVSFNEFTTIIEAEETSTLLDEEKLERNRVVKAEEDFDEFDDFPNKRKKIKKRSGLPKDLQGLMGEANLRFARGDNEDAIKMCMEVIRLAPRAAEPFQTLGMIYEEKGDVEKSLQFSLIAAYLNPNDSEEWTKLAEMSLEQGNIKQAVVCYSKAIKYDQSNVSLLWERCNLYEQLGERKKALEGYGTIIDLLKPEQASQGLQLSREVTKIHHEQGDISAALQVMEKAFSKFPTAFTSEDINLISELYINTKSYIPVIDIMRSQCGVKFISKDGSFADIKSATIKISPKVVKCIIPEVLPIDLQAKLVVCLIHLGGFHLVKNLVESLKQENPEEVGDLYLDVAEAYMEKNKFSDAFTLLEKLKGSVTYNVAAVWLKYADCLKALDRYEDAAAAYKIVIERAPAYAGARISLSSVLIKLGNSSEATDVLTQEYEHGRSQSSVDMEVLLLRCDMLYAQERWQEYIDAVKLSMLSHCQKAVTPQEVSIVFKNQSIRQRRRALRELKSVSGTVSCFPKFSNNYSTSDEMWGLFLKTCHLCYSLKKFDELQNICVFALTSDLFAKTPDRARDAELLSFLSCYYNRSIDFAYCLAKELVLKNINSNKVWNLFNQIVLLSQDLRHNRFCLRLTCKNMTNVALGIINGHNALLAGSYKHALGEYMCIYKQIPEDPLLNLCIGIIYINLASQKYASKRHSLVMQGVSFLHRYMQLRKESQESYYNMGRALHQVGLYPTAIFYYKKALECNSKIKCTTQKEAEVFDLSHEIAYNLALIYQNSGAKELASMYINRYCIV